MRTESNRCLSYISLCAALLLWAGTASAASYTVSPKIIDLTVQPRDILEEKIVVKNNSGSMMTLYPSVNNVTIGVDGGVQEFVTPSMSDRTSTLSSWLEISRVGFDLPGGETKEIPLTIRVNPTAVPGTYHALISYVQAGNATEAEAAFARGDGESAMVNVTIDDTKSELVSLGKFVVSRFVTKADNSAIHYQVANTGEGDITPRGDIIIYNQRGGEVASVTINPDNITIKPGETVQFSQDVPLAGLLGKYKAFMTMQYGEGQAAIYDTVFFYALPLSKLLILFGILLAVTIVSSLYIHHRYLRRQEDEDAESVPLEVKDSFTVGSDSDIVMKR